MGKKKSPLVGKRRTHEHLVADLAVNHVERQVLLGGGTVERTQRDYGVDLILFTYSPSGEVESGCVFIQVKATERLKWLRGDRRASFRLERSDLVGWLRELLPVILVVYDAAVERAYWVHVQGYFTTLPGFNLFTAGETVTAHLDGGQIFDPPAIRRLAAIRDAGR
ncbi:MAG: DUF4365 domain-containing protein [Gemmataceae bacterium]